MQVSNYLYNSWDDFKTDLKDIGHRTACSMVTTLSLDPRGYFLALGAEKAVTKITQQTVNELKIADRLPELSVEQKSKLYLASKISLLGAAVLVGKSFAGNLGYNISALGLLSAITLSTALKIAQMIYTISYPSEIISDQVDTVSIKSFEEMVLKSPVPVIVDAYATWCPPCRAMAPLLDECAKDLQGKVRFVKFNVDNEQQLAKDLEITSMPSFLIYDQGKLIEKKVGMQSKEQLLEALSLKS